jgi:hypothetical protein
MAPTYIDPAHGWAKMRSTLIPFIIITLFAIFFVGTWLQPHKPTDLREAGRGLAIPYANLPSGRYAVDVVINEASGLVVASRDQNISPKMKEHAEEYFVSAVPPNMCVPHRQFFVVSSNELN